MVRQANQKKRQQSEELCGATIRALTGISDLHHRGRSLFLSGKRVVTGAPHNETDALVDDFTSQRGAADGVALRLRHSNPELHRELSPEEPVSRLIFDLLEQLRVETLASDEFPGVKNNLYRRFSGWCLSFYHQGHAESQLGLLIYTIAQVAWSRLTGLPTLEETDDLIEVTRGTIAPVVGNEMVALRRFRQDQRAYAKQALIIAQIVRNSLSDLNTDDDPTRESENLKALSQITLALDFTDENEDSNIAEIVTGISKTLDDSDQTYRVYSRKYDSEYVAASKIRAKELDEFRQKLDRLVQKQGINIPRLARQISTLLATPRRDGWLFGEEEGLIDGRRLSQLVATPRERRLFRKDQYQYKNDCLVSILVDCSGSMKASIDYVAMLVDVFTRALDQAEIASEILGFTTGGWNGGQVHQDWVANRKPAQPGRLNEQCHLIFKNADTSWRKSRRKIAALFKSTQFREGLDGEAVEWAVQRMQKHGEARKILLVISDGSPMDTATSFANDEFYLDNHLKQVVSRYDALHDTEIYGIGVGLSLTPYYNHCMAIDLTESLANHVFTQILQMIAKAKRR
ncbi:MAG: cobaltochelatase CobT [Gammaproteobacteria bacterium]|jgi:cobaltochelatase CobT